MEIYDQNKTGHFERKPHKSKVGMPKKPEAPKSKADMPKKHS